MNKEITFEQIKEFLDFVLRTSQYTAEINPNREVCIYNNSNKRYVISRTFIESHEDCHLAIIYQQLIPGEYWTTIGSADIKISDIESAEFSVLLANLRQKNINLCIDNFNLKFFD